MCVINKIYVIPSVDCTEKSQRELIQVAGYCCDKDSVKLNLPSSVVFHLDRCVWSQHPLLCFPSCLCTCLCCENATRPFFPCQQQIQNPSFTKRSWASACSLQWLCNLRYCVFWQTRIAGKGLSVLTWVLVTQRKEVVTKLRNNMTD